jgi:pyruvate dehydrogenase E1 component alpha subunit
MLRLRSWLTDARLWDEAQEKAWLEECGRLVDIEIIAYLETKVQPVEAMFDYLYGDPPPDLLAQREAAMALDKASLEKRNG